VLTQRRYVVRLYRKGRSLGGILEDAHTGIEKPFNGARELVSLLRKSRVTSSQSTLPRGNSSITDPRGDARQPKRRVKKENRK
jgi:hypothetical protein